VTNDSNAYATRARAHALLNDKRAAASDFTRAITLAPVGNPELYIERAEALGAAGAKEEAVRGLDDGIVRMGPLVTLEIQAIDLDMSLKRYDSALKRIDAVMARLQRKESWLVRRGQVLKLAGREKESRAAYEAALAAVEQLPPAHRNTRATLQLESTIRSALRSDDSPSKEAKQTP
jgi:tetratricopeptide (TPR) repeat protein